MELPAYYYLVPVLQALCAAHVLWTRADYRWLFLIFFMPGLGSLVYLGVEVLPRQRRASVDGLELPLFAGLRLRRLERQLRFSDTLDNRVALAEAYHRSGRHAEAIATYEPALTGIAKGNPYLLYGYAQACYAAGRDDDALAALGRVNPANGDRLKPRTLLLARLHERRGDPAAAEAAYLAVARGFDGEEARCRYGLFLCAQGRHQEGRALLRAMLDDAEMNDRDYRRRQRAWYRLAAAKLKEPLATAAASADQSYARG